MLCSFTSAQKHLISQLSSLKSQDLPWSKEQDDITERHQNLTVGPKWELSFLEDLCFPSVASSVIRRVGKHKWQQNKFLWLVLSSPNHRKLCSIMNHPWSLRVKTSCWWQWRNRLCEARQVRDGSLKHLKDIVMFLSPPGQRKFSKCSIMDTNELFSFKDSRIRNYLNSNALHCNLVT